MTEINNAIELAKSIVSNASNFNAALHEVVEKSIFNPNMYINSGIDVIPDRITHIVINGCGGTGGWFIPKLGKILRDAAQKQKLGDKLSVLFCDGDTVSYKNIIRQNFIERDIGENKAKVLANRYSVLFPDCVEIGYIDKYVSHSNIIEAYPAVLRDKFVDINKISPFEYVSQSGGIGRVKNEFVLIFNFVDNAISRRIIHSAAHLCSQRNGYRTYLVIDAGNNLYNGQVSTSYYHLSRSDIFTSNPYSYYARNPDEIYDNEFVKLENCADADLAINNPEQLFNANDMSATVTANLVNNIFADGKVHYALTKFVTGKNISVQNTLPYVNLRINNFNNTARNSQLTESSNIFEQISVIYPYRYRINSGDNRGDTLACLDNILSTQFGINRSSNQAIANVITAINDKCKIHTSATITDNQIIDNGRTIAELCNDFERFNKYVEKYVEEAAKAEELSKAA